MTNNDSIKKSELSLYFDLLPQETQLSLINKYVKAAKEGIKELVADGSGNTIVHDVVHLHSDKLFSLVFQQGIPYLNQENNEGSTPLLESILAGDILLVFEILKREVSSSINQPNKKGITPLHAAVLLEDKPLLEELLKKGASLSINSLTDEKKTPLHVALSLKDDAILHLLLKHGAAESLHLIDSKGLSPKQTAIITGQVSALKLMLEFSPSLAKTFNHPDAFGVTDLQRAARSGQVEMMSLLLSHSVEEEIKLSSEASFNAQDLQSCQSIPLKEALHSLAIDLVAFPLTLAQNFCNVMVRLTTGEILKIPNAKASEIKAFLMQKKYGSQWESKEMPNILTFYLSPGHGFLRLECNNCDDNKPYNMNKGFYPAGRKLIVSPSPVLQNSKSQKDFEVPQMIFTVASNDQKFFLETPSHFLFSLSKEFFDEIIKRITLSDNLFTQESYLEYYQRLKIELIDRQDQIPTYDDFQNTLNSFQTIKEYLHFLLPLLYQNLRKTVKENKEDFLNKEESLEVADFFLKKDEREEIMFIKKFNEEVALFLNQFQDVLSFKLKTSNLTELVSFLADYQKLTDDEEVTDEKTSLPQPSFFEKEATSPLLVEKTNVYVESEIKEIKVTVEKTSLPQPSFSDSKKETKFFSSSAFIAEKTVSPSDPSGDSTYVQFIMKHFVSVGKSGQVPLKMSLEQAKKITSLIPKTAIVPILASTVQSIVKVPHFSFQAIKKTAGSVLQFKKAIGAYKRKVAFCFESYIYNNYLMTKEQEGELGNENWYENDSDTRNSLKIMFAIDDRQAKKALDKIKEVTVSCSENPEKSCRYHLIEHNCVDFMQDIFQSIQGNGDFVDYFTNEQLSEGHLHTPSRIFEFKAMDYGFIRSRGLSHYIKGGFYQTINNVFNRISPFLGGTEDFFKKAYPLPTRFVSLQEIVTKEEAKVEESQTRAKLSSALFQESKESQQDLSDSFSRPYAVSLTDNLYLALTLGKLALNTFQSLSNRWSQITGVKVTRQQLLIDCQEGRQVINHSFAQLDTIGLLIDSALFALNKEIKTLRQQNRGEPSAFKILQEEKKQGVKARDQQLDLIFEALGLQKELKQLIKSRGLPSVTYLEKLKQKIHVHSLKTAHLNQQIEEIFLENQEAA